VRHAPREVRAGPRQEAADDADGTDLRGTPWHAVVMTLRDDRPTDVSVRQFAADSGSVTRGLRQGHAYTLTLNGRAAGADDPDQAPSGGAQG
jgi:hypothetical protein